MAKRDTIVLVVIRDDEGRERLMPYRVETDGLEADIASLQEQLDPGDEVVRHHVLPKDNYFVKCILLLGELGDGDACAIALGELEELVSAIAPAVLKLNK
jgi:hypothetical protein